MAVHHPALYTTTVEVVHGIGVKSSAAHRSGDFLGFYSGRVVTEAQYTEWAARDPTVEHIGFEIPGTDHLVVRVDASDTIGFVNEVPPGDTANVVALAIVLNEGNAIAYFAGQNIEPHSELLVHYGDEYAREYPIGLECTTPDELQMCHEVIDVHRASARCVAARVASQGDDQAAIHYVHAQRTTDS